MARRPFSGDVQDKLPKGKREPYRLWFEHLKIVQRYPNIHVDKELYRNWNVKDDTEFDAWWEDYWRVLFATEAQAALVRTTDQFVLASNDPWTVVLRVSLAGTKKRRLEDLEEILASLSVPVSSGRELPPRPAFALSAKRSMNLKTLRGMLKYLQLYEEKHWDLEHASRAYFKWASDWNAKVRSGKWKRPLAYLPNFLGAFTVQIENRMSKPKRGPAKVGNEERYDALRGQARRFIRRGETILRNVAEGRFPGAF